MVVRDRIGRAYVVKIKNRFKSVNVPVRQKKGVRMPLVSIGPSGIGGEYQWEW